MKSTTSRVREGPEYCKRSEQRFLITKVTGPLMDSQNLQKLGLSRHGANIFRTLLQENYLTPKELSEQLTIPLQTLYQELKQLEEYGLISSRGSYPSEYYAEDPAIGMNVVVQRHINQLKDEEVMAKRLLDEANTLYREKFQDGYCSQRYAFFTFKNPERAVSFLQTQIKNARKEVVCYDLPNYLLQIVSTAFNSVEERKVFQSFIIHEEDYESVFIPVGGRVYLGDLRDKRREVRHILDDKNALQAEICVDGERFITITYLQPFNLESMVVHSFYSPNLVELTKRNYLAHVGREPVTLGEDRQVNLRHLVLRALKDGCETKRSILSYVTGQTDFSTSGTELKELVQQLVDENVIEVEKVKQSRGRPKEVIRLLDQLM